MRLYQMHEELKTILFVWWVRTPRKRIPDQLEKALLLAGIDPYETVEKWESISETT